MTPRNSSNTRKKDDQNPEDWAEDNSDFPADPYYPKESFPEYDKLQTDNSLNPDYNDFAIDGSESEIEDIDQYTENYESIQKVESPNKEITIRLPLRCVGSGIGGFVAGGAVGGVFGLFQGITEGYSLGIIRDRSFPGVLAGITFSSALSFGTWLGSYQFTKCSLISVRGKRDPFNSFGGGFVAGFLSSIRTRSPPAMIVSGLASGALMSVLDFMPRSTPI